MKTCYTVILGNYDQLRNPTVITPGWRYVCITDTPEICDGTVYKPLCTKALRMRITSLGREKASRVYKWRCWRLTDGISIYHDGNFEVTGNLDDFISPVLSYYFATRPHPSRYNALSEVKACLHLDKDTPEGLKKLRKQIEREIEPDDSEKWKEQYKDRTYWFVPNKHGLFENGILVFNPHQNQEDLQILTEQMAYVYVPDTTHRDQPILPFLLWKHNLDAALIDRTHAAKFFQYHVTHLK